MTQQTLTSAMITPAEWEEICGALGLAATSPPVQAVERARRLRRETEAATARAGEIETYLQIILPGFRTAALALCQAADYACTHADEQPDPYHGITLDIRNAFHPWRGIITGEPDVTSD
jgi:hypothetical protein